MAPGSVDWLTIFLVFLNVGIAAFPLTRFKKFSEINPFHPLVFFFIMFTIPMILVKGLALGCGFSSYEMDIIANNHYYLNLGLFLVAIAWISMITGYYAPAGKGLSRLAKLPHPLVSDRHVSLAPVLLLALCGLINIFILMERGAYGATLSRLEGDTVLVSIAGQLARFFEMSTFLVLLYSMRYQKRPWKICAFIMAATYCMLVILMGNRSGLLLFIIFIGGAYFFSRKRHIRFREVGISAVFIVAATAIGVLFLTQYRLLRQSAFGIENISINEIVTLLDNAYHTITGSENSTILSLLSWAFMDRLGNIDAFSLVLARAQELKLQEQSLGIDSNILNDLFWGFIPRFIYPQKPIVSNLGLHITYLYYSSNYFNWSAVTKFGDLYRNFGYIGIPIGMGILGIYMRFLYERFIIMEHGRIFGCFAYFFFLSSISMEGTYTDFLTALTRLSALLLFYFLFLHMFKLFRKAKVPHLMMGHPFHESKFSKSPWSCG